MQSDGQRGIDGAPWGGGAQVQAMRSPVHIVKDVVHACLYAECLAQLVGGGQSPQLVALAVAVYLVVALAAQTTIETYAQLIVLAEVVMPSGIDVGLVVSHSVDGHTVHDVFFGIILVGLGCPDSCTSLLL